jgi:POT family proton-dependent oligopeptide transporter
MKTFFGHPRGLSTLFFTELWERFSFYGMRAILILFMVAPTAHGGLGFPTAKAGMIYGIYMSMVYLASVPGGWIADKILGARKSILLGGMIIIAGHIALAFPALGSFYFGLALVVIGTGMLKPNASTMVGQLYAEKDIRRDAGFYIFYMAINTGALTAPLVVGTVAERVNWHYGFGLAAIGMTLGVIQFAFGSRWLAGAGLAPKPDPAARKTLFLATGLVVLIGALFTGLSALGWITISTAALSNSLGLFLFLLTCGIFGWLLLVNGWKPEERRRLVAVMVLFFASALFWAAFEQAGSTLTLFGDRATRRVLFGFSFPTSWYQTLNSGFLVALAPVFAALWTFLGRKAPSTTTKFALGLVFAGLGFAVLVPVANGTAVSPWWLIVTYLCHTVGELLLSPIGLSAMTKLAPVRIASFIMGVWFLSISVGEFIGGRIAAVYEDFSLPYLFGGVFLFCAVCAGGLMLLNPFMRKLMGETIREKQPVA